MAVLLYTPLDMIPFRFPGKLGALSRSIRWTSNALYTYEKAEERQHYWRHSETSTRTEDIISCTASVNFYLPERDKRQIATGSIHGQDYLTQPEPYSNICTCMHLGSLGDRCAVLSHEKDSVKITPLYRCMHCSRNFHRSCRPWDQANQATRQQYTSFSTKYMFITRDSKLQKKHIIPLVHFYLTSMLQTRWPCGSVWYLSVSQTPSNKRKSKVKKIKNTPFYIPERISSSPKGTSPKM